MTKEDFLQEMEKIFDGCLEVAKNKNADYTGASADPFANFATCERLGVRTDVGMMVRMSDKWERLVSLTNSEAKVCDERMEDTLLDLVNYCVILTIWLRSTKFKTAIENASN